MLKLNKHRFKPIFHTINYSSTFPMRTVCKKCGLSYNYYCFNLYDFLYKDVNILLKELVKYINKMSFHDDYFTDYNPSIFTSISSFGIQRYNTYNPRLHSVNKNNFNKFDSGMVKSAIFIYCKCGVGCWSVSANNKAPENINRLCKYSHTIKSD